MFNNFRDRLLFIKLSRDEQYARLAFFILGVVCTAIVIDLIYLNLFLLNRGNNAVFTSSSIKHSITSVPSPMMVDSLSPTSIPTPVPTTITSSGSSGVQSGGVKDLYIPLGSGTTQSNVWTNIPGAEAQIDFGQYQHIKEVRFEASIYVPDSNEAVSVRLYNITDNHPVWYSQVTTNSNNNNYLISGPVSYVFGQKLYQVQMETQLQAPANLVQSRIHVILN